jgi:hypothetical protein
MYNFLSSEFQNGRSGVFTVLYPEYTIGEFRNRIDQDNESRNISSKWMAEVILHETHITEVFDLVVKAKLHRHKDVSTAGGQPGSISTAGDTSTYLEKFYDEETIELLKHVGRLSDIKDSSQFTLKAPIEIFDVSAQYAMRCFKRLCESAFFCSCLK